MNAEQSRIDLPLWKKWGPYVSDRQWGTVREDYSAVGNCLGICYSHDMARSKAYRWGEEGIGGICDEKQFLCFAIALWNKKDPILKERYFGLTGNQGNHGEDVKELYYYLDSTPTHSYMKMLYKYPQAEFPYQLLIDENNRRGKTDPEFELMDTGIFNEDHYFDVFVEYAKNDPEDILIKITVCNRSAQDASAPGYCRPSGSAIPGAGVMIPINRKCHAVRSGMHKNRTYHNTGIIFYTARIIRHLLFTENESNNQKLYGSWKYQRVILKMASIILLSREMNRQ